MGKRFSDLQEVYETLSLINFDFNSLPATNKYRKYKEWREDPDKRKRAESSIRNSGRKVTLGLKAFGLNDGGGTLDQVKVKVGSRAWTYIKGVGGEPLSTLNLTEAQDLSAYQNMISFKPAKVVAAVRETNATSPTSDITGVKYRKTTGQTYTLPFGKGTGDSLTEFGTQDVIIEAYQATHVVTFLPEVIRRS
ncbi:hypothetical protein [Cyanothece sp. BG0011]|uniref:hypothetical protein n=1 Tax=Cyanothece sp. BG0011 TaxID=2082950 RepID=UPI000D1E08B4|nr:hypothetical protein [Cyanothece sp. BG0011]